MTTREFIALVVAGNIRKYRRVSSVFYNGTDCIYSYGYHYPLLLKIGDSWIVNDRGYSNTTRRHISWAREYASFSASFASQEAGWGIAGNAVQNLIAGVQNEIKYIQTEYPKLSKRAFRQRAIFDERFNKLLELNSWLSYQREIGNIK